MSIGTNSDDDEINIQYDIELKKHTNLNEEFKVENKLVVAKVKVKETKVSLLELI